MIRATMNQTRTYWNCARQQRSQRSNPFQPSQRQPDVTSIPARVDALERPGSARSV